MKGAETGDNSFLDEQNGGISVCKFRSFSKKMNKTISIKFVSFIKKGLPVPTNNMGTL